MKRVVCEESSNAVIDVLPPVHYALFVVQEQCLLRSSEHTKEGKVKNKHHSWKAIVYIKNATASTTQVLRLYLKSSLALAAADVKADGVRSTVDRDVETSRWLASAEDRSRRSSLFTSVIKLVWKSSSGTDVASFEERFFHLIVNTFYRNFAIES
ncbi:uncharacterized protein V6R79_013438 [Siganus canaliculatus]